MKKVLFVCVHNAGRSQMAEAFFNIKVSGKAIAESAGTMPGPGVNSTVVEVMSEARIDLWARKPKLLTVETMESADRIITMGCMDEAVCPAALAPTEDWEIEDPAGKPIETVRKIRDEIRTRVEKLLEEPYFTGNS
ncbi:MAG: arsenate reductase ArsC [Dehalococcoidia bacterium]|nr:arsenate reductase ArsC [Dehalococcoidia bacterium]